MWLSVAKAPPTLHQQGFCMKPYHKNVVVYKVFNGFRRNDKVFMEMIRSSLWGGLAETHVFPLFLEVPGGGPLTCVQRMGLLEHWAAM